MGKKRKRREAEPAPDPRPCATLTLDVNFTEVEAIYCPACGEPTASSVTALATTTTDPSTALLRVSKWLCHDCGAEGRG